MRSELAASTLLSAFLWSVLLLSLFATPALMAARSTDAAPDTHTADLIRQHREATSPLELAPEQEAQVHSHACQDPENAAVRGQDEQAAERDAGADDEPMIRRVGTRAKRIRV